MHFIDFEYDKERLSDYGMVICNFNGNKVVETMPSGADISYNQIKPSGTDRFHLYSSTYESAYTTTFQICKNPCGNKSDGSMYLQQMKYRPSKDGFAEKTVTILSK